MPTGERPEEEKISPLILFHSVQENNSEGEQREVIGFFHWKALRFAAPTGSRILSTASVTVFRNRAWPWRKSRKSRWLFCWGLKLLRRRGDRHQRDGFVFRIGSRRNNPGAVSAGVPITVNSCPSMVTSCRRRPGFQSGNKRFLWCQNHAALPGP